MTEQAAKKISPCDQLCLEIVKLEPQIKKVLPPHVSVEKFIRNAQTYMRTKPRVVDCERNSVHAAVLNAAAFGLMLDGEEAAIIPRGRATPKQGRFSPGYQGYLKLVRNSGEIASITVKVVYKDDKFDRWTDENGEHLMHRENPDGEQKEITHAYMITKTRTGATYIEVMTKRDLEKVRKMSSNQDEDGPWNTWEEMMSRKSVIRRGYKVLPKSTDIDQLPDHQNLNKLIHADDDLFLPEKTEEPPAPAATSSSRLKDAVSNAMGKAPAQQPPAETPAAAAQDPAPIDQQPL